MKRTKTLGWLVGAAARIVAHASQRGNRCIVAHASQRGEARTVTLGSVTYYPKARTVTLGSVTYYPKARTVTLGSVTYYVVMMAAALLIAGCSSEDGVIEEQTTQPAAQTATKIHVTVGAGISDPTPDPSPTGAGSSATTRSAVTQDGGTRTLQFTAGDKLYVYRKVAEGVNLAGELTMTGSPTNEGKSATFSGELKVYNDAGTETSYEFGEGENPLTGSTATLLHAGAVAGLYTLNADKSLTPQTELMLASDVATLMTTALKVTGQYNGSAYALSTTASPAPIFNCSIIGLAPTTTYHAALGYANSEADFNDESVWLADMTTYYPTFTTDVEGAVSFAFATNMTGPGYYVMMLSTDGNFYQQSPDMLTCILGQRDTEHQNALTSKVYNLSRMKSGSSLVKYVNLTGQTGDVTVNDGYTVIGTLSGHQLLIADGATVTLSGASVTGPEGYDYGAIRCLGDATIILTDGTENTALSGSGNKYAAVSVPEGKTLTINGGSAGTGTLTADARVEGNGNSRAGIGYSVDQKKGGNIVINGGIITAYGNAEGAGIGAAEESPIGDITITGGTVTATGVKAPGIGAGGGRPSTDSSCGNILISGGTVRATGGEYCAGIGCSINYDCGCGTITITKDIDRVEATRGSYGYDIRWIGKAGQGSCGTVTIDGKTIQNWMGLDADGANAAYQDGYLSEDDYVYWQESGGDVLTFSHLNFASTRDTWTLTKK